MNYNPFKNRAQVLEDDTTWGWCGIIGRLPEKSQPVHKKEAQPVWNERVNNARSAVRASLGSNAIPTRGREREAVT